MINSNDLSNLFTSTRREAQGLLPQLVRRLIFASCSDNKLAHFEMAAGDDVRLHGWDGVLTFHGEHPYVPTGDSVWEMGVSADPESKADDDYAKRTADPRGVTPASTTFVFVTPHVWAGRNKWVESKCAEGVWAGVQAIDGSVLATWLERFPAVALWIADALGRSIRGLHSLDRYWESAIDNRYATRVNPDLIIGGRDGVCERLIEFLQSPSGAISLVGETAEEAIAFAAAVCKKAFSAEQRSRLLILSEPTATEHLAMLSQEHIVILTDPALYPNIRSEALGHLHFVVPEQRDARTNKATDSIDLDTPARNAVAASLQQMGWPEEEADRIAAESKGSLQAVLWMIAQTERGALDWASGRAASELAPLVLAGQWTVNDHPDHEVVAVLAQRDYQEVKQTLAEWSGDGKPLGRRGAIWDWKAWGFAWTRLAPSLQRDDVDRFLKIAKEVLGAADPALELPPKDRWLAGIRGKVHRHSFALREGLAHSLVLLAVNGDLIPGTDGQAAAHHFVESLLQVPEPAKRWISIASWLPDLAEAAPDAFLDALERFTDDPAAVKELFAEGGMFGSSPHTHVLWALERLAWSPDHFGRVVLAFGRLAAVDPGGTLMNRPGRSLRMIMLSWHPATGATVADRMSVLRLLQAQSGEVGWRCAASLLPQAHDIGEPFARPKWRAWAKNTSERVTPHDYWTFQEQLVDLLLEHAGRHGARWTVLLQAAPALCAKHTELGHKVVEAIHGLNPAEFDREEAHALGDAARALVLNHENMHKSNWAMQGVALETFKELREHLQPRVRRDRDRWLFAHSPEVLREYDIPIQERERRLSELRAEAVSAVLADGGFGDLPTWAGEVESPECLGTALAEQDLPPYQEQQLIEAGLDAVGTPGNRSPLARLVHGYTFAKARSADSTMRQGTTAAALAMEGQAASLFLQALPCGQKTWELVERQDNEVRSIYWREIGLFVLTLDECETAIPKLIAANRPFKVIGLIAMLVLGVKRKGRSDDEHDRIVTLARAALSAQIDHLPQDEYAVAGSISYDIDALLNYLESRTTPRQELARWEWSWLPFMSNGSRNLRAIQAELSEDPELFVDLLKCVYRPSKGDESEQNMAQEAQSRAELAYQVLRTWNRVPGLSDEALGHGEDTLGEGLGPISALWTGTVDEAALTAWVDQAIVLATDADRIEICFQHIGRQFAFAPADSDGVWPCVEVRRSIERVGNDDLEQGLVLGVCNRRGVHRVARDGEQETLMASKFREWCEQVRLEYPRTGTVLRRLAERYEREARRGIEQGHLEEYND